MRRLTIKEQRYVAEKLQEVLTILDGVDFHPDATSNRPPEIIGQTSGELKWLLSFTFGVAPVKRLDSDENGEPRVVEGTKVLVGREAETCEEVHAHA